MKKATIAIGVALGISFAATAGAQGNSRVLKADLQGANEVPPVTTETTGRFELYVSRDGQSAEYTLSLSRGERITQAHLHCAPAGVNGPVVVFLAGVHDKGWDVDGKWIDNATLTDTNVGNGTCGATLSDVLDQARIGNVYVNVHSTGNPAGVVRGQLLPPSKK